MQTTPQTSLEYKIEKSTIIITKFIGSETEVVIPEEIVGLPVREIGDDAFRRCANVTSITLLKGLETIEPRAFFGCARLTEFIAAEENACFRTKNGVIYSKDGAKLILFPTGKRGVSLFLTE